jgi:hypothetical protein
MRKICFGGFSFLLEDWKYKNTLTAISLSGGGAGQLFYAEAIDVSIL